MSKESNAPLPGRLGELRPASVEAFVLRYPLTQHVVTSFGVMKDRPAVLVRVRDADGAEGWGEVWCNFPAPAAEYRADLIEQVLAPLCTSGNTFENPRALKDTLTARTHVLSIQCGEPGPFSACIAAVEMASWDLLARRAGTPLWQLLGGRGTVPVYASGIHPKEAHERIRAASAAGHTRFKIKVGFSLDADVARVAEACKAYPAEAWMIDANQAWDERASAQAIERFRELPLQWLEEPMPADADPAAWRRLAALGLPLAGGENIRGLDDFTAAAEWLSVLQPDVGKWGGVSSCLDVAGIARAQERWFCPHWLGSGVGLAFSLAILDAHLAQGAQRSPGWAEVDCNPNPLRDDVMDWCQSITGGNARLHDLPGIGPAPAWPAAMLVQR